MQFSIKYLKYLSYSWWTSFMKFSDSTSLYDVRGIEWANHHCVFYHKLKNPMDVNNKTCFYHIWDRQKTNNLRTKASIRENLSNRNKWNLMFDRNKSVYIYLSSEFHGNSAINFNISPLPSNLVWRKQNRKHLEPLSYIIYWGKQYILNYSQ